MPFVVWTIPSPYPREADVGAARLVSTPSAGAHRPAGLARDHQEPGFPEFEQFCIAGFPASTRCRSPISPLQVRCVYQFRHARSVAAGCIKRDRPEGKRFARPPQKSIKSRSERWTRVEAVRRESAAQTLRRRRISLPGLK